MKPTVGSFLFSLFQLILENKNVHQDLSNVSSVASKERQKFRNRFYLLYRMQSQWIVQNTK